MTGVAVGLVLVSALMHASWNLLTKRSVDPLAFLFAHGLVAGVVYLIPALVMLDRHGLPVEGLPYLIVSGVVESIYLFALAAAYRHGALSLAYPIARGTGVLLVPLLAIPLLDERPTAVAFAGIGAILTGIITINVIGARSRVGAELEHGRRGILFALLTGVSIATYSLIDKVGVGYIHPVVYAYGLEVMMTICVAPYILARRRAVVAEVWRTTRGAVIAAGIMNLGTYLIILFAMSLDGANVSYIVPLRETSIVFATILGVVVLKEQIGRMRVLGSATIALGVLLIAFGG